MQSKHIKRKKHRGKKDPLSNSKQKFEKIKYKINNTPINPNDQEIPKKLQKVINHMDGSYRKALKLRRQKKNNLSQQEPNDGFDLQREENKQYQAQDISSKMEDGLIDTAEFLEKETGWYPKTGKPFRPIPTLKQFPNERFNAFRSRVADATEAVLQESRFRDKFGVDVVRNEFGEMVKLEIIPDAKYEQVKEKKRKKLEKRKLNIEKRRAKWKEVNNSDNEDNDVDVQEKKLFRNEKIKFGEVVHRPPELNTDKLDKLLKSKKDEKNFIFLQKLRKEATVDEHKKPSRKRKEAVRNLEAERIAAVQAYRQLKLNKKPNVETRMII